MQRGSSETILSSAQLLAWNIKCNFLIQENSTTPRKCILQEAAGSTLGPAAWCYQVHIFVVTINLTIATNWVPALCHCKGKAGRSHASHLRPLSRMDTMRYCSYQRNTQTSIFWRLLRRIFHLFADVTTKASNKTKGCYIHPRTDLMSLNYTLHYPWAFLVRLVK